MSTHTINSTANNKRDSNVKSCLSSLLQSSVSFSNEAIAVTTQSRNKNTKLSMASFKSKLKSKIFITKRNKGQINADYKTIQVSIFFLFEI